MRHEFDSERQEYSEHSDRHEAKMRDKERGQARKVKNALQREINATPERNSNPRGGAR